MATEFELKIRRALGLELAQAARSAGVSAELALPERSAFSNVSARSIDWPADAEQLIQVCWVEAEKAGK